MVLDRFEKYMESKGLTDYRVTVDCGLSNGLLNKARKSGTDLSAKSIEKILSVYTDLNRVWLLTGHGPMIIENATINNSCNQGNINNGTMTDSNQNNGSANAIIEQQNELIAKLVEENIRQGQRIDKLIELLSK